MNFGDGDPEPTPESRQRLYGRAVKWRAGRLARENWAESDFEAERVRLEAEIAAHPVTRIPTPDYAGWRRVDVSDFAADRIKRAA